MSVNLTTDKPFNLTKGKSVNLTTGKSVNFTTGRSVKLTTGKSFHDANAIKSGTYLVNLSNLLLISWRYVINLITTSGKSVV